MARCRRDACRGFLVAVAALVVLAPAARAAGPEVLYDQPIPDGLATGIVSGEVPGNPDETSEGADDFVLTKTSQIESFVFFSSGEQPFTIAVTIYADGGSKPGVELFHQSGLQVTNPGSDYTVHLTGVPQLTAGSYWVSMRFSTDGVWAVTESQHGDPAVWKNPLDGYGSGCTDFEPLTSCGLSGTDFAFRVLGPEAPAPPPTSGGGSGPVRHFELGKLTLKRGGRAKLAAYLPVGGTVVVADARRSRKLIKRRKSTFAGGGLVSLPILPTSVAKSLLADGLKAKATASVTFIPADGDAQTLSRKVVLRP